MNRNKKHYAISDTVYERLFAQITNGRLKPGQKITELHIAESEGISRAPVREALKRLASDGLIVLVPRSGCYVCKWTQKDVNEIFDIRERLECLCMEYAIENLDPAQLESLKEKFLKCREMDDDRLIREELKLDSKLHDMILEASNSRVLQDILGKLLARIQVFRACGTNDATRAKRALETHIQILDSILKNNQDKAIKLMREHIMTSRKNALNSLDLMTEAG